MVELRDHGGRRSLVLTLVSQHGHSIYLVK